MVFLGKLFSKFTTRTKLTFLKCCGGVNVDGSIFVDVSGFCTLENALPAKERTAVASDNTFILKILIDVPFYGSGRISFKGGPIVVNGAESLKAVTLSWSLGLPRCPHFSRAHARPGALAATASGDFVGR